MPQQNFQAEIFWVQEIFFHIKISRIMYPLWNANWIMHQTICVWYIEEILEMYDTMRRWSSKRIKHAAMVYVFSFRRKCCFCNRLFRMTFTGRQTCKVFCDTYMNVMINGEMLSSFMQARLILLSSDKTIRNLWSSWGTRNIRVCLHLTIFKFLFLTKCISRFSMQSQCEVSSRFWTRCVCWQTSCALIHDKWRLF